MKKVTCTILFLTALSCWAQHPAVSTVTPEQKVYELSLIWREMSYNFDNMNNCMDLDADSLYRAFLPIVSHTANDFEYTKSIMRYLACFKNSHTFVVDSPSWTDSLSQLYIRTEYRKGKVFLTNFSKKYADKMHIWDEIVSINGIPAVKFMLEEFYPYVPATNDEYRILTAMSNKGPWTMFPYGTTFQLILKGEKEYSIALPAEKMIGEPSEWFVQDFNINRKNGWYMDSKSQTGYLRIVECSSEAKDFFLGKLDSIRSCETIILDLTHNTGGNSTNTEDISGFLAKTESFTTDSVLSKMNIAYMKAVSSYSCDESSDPDNDLCKMKRGEYFYALPPTEYANSYYPSNFKGKVIILQGSETGSAAEWLISKLKQDKSIVSYGGKTMGATGNPFHLVLPSGLHIQFNTWRTFDFTGTETSMGINPDVEIDFSECYKTDDIRELYHNIVKAIQKR